jgi:hypothetical protein
MPALYVNLMPKDQDLGYQRSSRPEQPDQRRPNKAARFPHSTEGLRDSASDVSPIRFTTGTVESGSVMLSFDSWPDTDVADQPQKSNNQAVQIHPTV